MTSARSSARTVELTSGHERIIANIKHSPHDHYFLEPQSNAKVKRFYCTLNDILAKILADRQDTWDLNLTQFLAAIRLNVSKATD